MSTEEKIKEFYNKIDALEKKFQTERNEINEYIKVNIIEGLDDIKKLSQIQVHCASQRQRLSDFISSKKGELRRQNDKIFTVRKKLYAEYRKGTRGSSLTMNDSQIHKCIDADLEHYSNYKEVLENQIEWYKRTIEGIDKLGFVIRNKIEITKFLEGSY